jgi:hypothetical protein
VVPIRPDLPAPADRAIDRSRETNGQPLYAANERLAVPRLYQEMDVVALDGEVADPEGLPLRESDCCADSREHACGA